MKRWIGLLFFILVFGAGDGSSKGSRVPEIDLPQGLPQNCPWDLKALSRAPHIEWLADGAAAGGIKSFLMSSVDYMGQPTHAFGYYSNPDLLMGRTPKKRSFPGVILLHGGGGRAFREWVEKWAAEGYAALAIDLSGQGVDGVRLSDGGPGLSDTRQVFFNAEQGDPQRMWSYHAVATAILSHSLLLSFPEVDPRKTCLTGISWGGYLTCIVGSLDNRFRAAVPVYGCGFYDELPFFGKGMMDELSESGKRHWMEFCDASVYLPYGRIPFLFLTGSNDTAYTLFAYRKSYSLVADSLRQICIRPGMLHGHEQGWEPDEIRCFFDGIVRGGCPLIRIGDVITRGDSLGVRYTSPLRPTGATLYYTRDTVSDNAVRQWQTGNGRIDVNNHTVWFRIPQQGFEVFFVTLRDVRHQSSSTGFLYRREAGL